MTVAVMLAGLGLAACGSSSSTPKDGGTGTGGAGTAGTTGGGSGGKGTAGTSGATGGKGGSAAGAGGGAQSTSFLGASCATAHDCGTVLDCLKPGGNDFYGAAGPAGGYCTIQCSGATDANCTKAGGVCQNINSTAAPIYYCFESCTVESDPTVTEKCQSRPDVACQPLTGTAGDTSGICFPTCSSDAECPASRKCLINVCVDMSITLPGQPLYNHCDPKAMAPAVTTDPVPPGLCQEQCLSSSAGTLSFCSTNCVVGSNTACNYAVMSTPLAPTATTNHGICAPFSMTAQIGDLGYCIQQCDKAADCRDQTDTGLTCDTTAQGMGIDHGFCSWP
jgi:hypothetical protein